MTVYCKQCPYEADGLLDYDSHMRNVHEFPVHTVRGKVIGPEGSPYGVTHDYECPGCQGTSFTASPRSETYWAS